MNVSPPRTSKGMRMNIEETKKWVSYLAGLHTRSGGGTELRLLYGDGKSYAIFAHGERDLMDAIQSVPKVILDANPAWYTTLNPVSYTLEKSCKPMPFADANDIVDYLWLPLDFDPIRFEINSFGERQALSAAGLSASDEELRNAEQAVGFVSDTINLVCGVAPTVLALSGNGMHSMYRVEARGDIPETKSLVHSILKMLGKIYTETPLRETWVRVDTTVANPARIWKLYGSVANKGENTKERPWRTSKVLRISEEERALTRTDLAEILSKLNAYYTTHKISVPKPAPSDVGHARVPREDNVVSSGGSNDWILQFRGYDLTGLDVVSAMGEAGILNGEQPENLSSRGLVSVICPNAGEHSSDTGPGQTVILPRGERGAFPAFQCAHDHCQHMNGAEYLFTKVLGLDLVKKHCPVFEGVSATPLMPPEEAPISFTSGPVEFVMPNYSLSMEDVINGPGFYSEEIRKTREILVEGFLSRGEINSLQAPTKVGKTWLLMDASIRWSNGLEFLGLKPVKPMKILFIDPELFRDSGARRMRTVKNQLQLANNNPNINLNNIHYLPLRGKPLMLADDPWRELITQLEVLLEKLPVDLVVLDSIYQFEGDKDSNSRGVITRMLNGLKTVAGENTAIIYTHHFAKGNASEKSVLDRASGSAAYNQAIDGIMTVTPLKDDDCYAIEFNLRDYPKRDKIGVRRSSNLPLLEVAGDVDVNRVDTALTRRWSVAENVMAIIRDVIVEKRRTMREAIITRDELFGECRRRLEVGDKWIKDGIALLREEGHIAQSSDRIGPRTVWEMSPQGESFARNLTCNEADGGIMTIPEIKDHERTFKDDVERK